MVIRGLRIRAQRPDLALDQAETAARANALKLVSEHEMGELFKVLVLGRGLELDPVGCREGDRSHTL